MAYRECDESVVNRAQEDDGPCHHRADDAEGPARSQDRVNLGDKNGTQCPRTAARGRQQPHVHTLQEVKSTLMILKRGIQPFDHVLKIKHHIHYTIIFSPEVWVRGFWNTVCRTWRCRLRIRCQSRRQLRYTGRCVMQEYTGTRSVDTGSLWALKSCWRLTWPQISDWPVSCFLGLGLEEKIQNIKR